MKAIAAMSLNRVIGNNGKIPWHLPLDFKWFKQTTMGAKLLMGRKTFESVGKALPGRTTYILTNDPNKVMRSPCANAWYLDESKLLSHNEEFLDNTWVCGGTAVYEKFIPQCSEVLLTIVLEEYPGDAVMPVFEDLFHNSEILRETRDFWIVRYWK
jgi:dihydrofolate reductase